MHKYEDARDQNQKFGQIISAVMQQLEGNGGASPQLGQIRQSMQNLNYGNSGFSGF